MAQIIQSKVMEAYILCKNRIVMSLKAKWLSIMDKKVNFRSLQSLKESTILIVLEWSYICCLLANRLS